jgi:hypothetical protein
VRRRIQQDVMLVLSMQFDEPRRQIL